MISLLYSAALALAAEAPPEAPAFEFKGIIAGQPANTREFFSCRPSRESCHVGFDLAGCSTTGIIRFNNSMLSRMFLTPRSNCMSLVAEAFIAKYGKPTSTRTETWRNGMGAVLDNGVMEWRFKTGVLTFKQTGYRLDLGEIVYEDENRLPPEPPNVNF